MRSLADLVFGSAVWLLAGYAGFIFVGPIEGVAIWRILALAGVGGFVHGYITSQERLGKRIDKLAGSLPIDEELARIAMALEDAVCDEHHRAYAEVPDDLGLSCITCGRPATTVVRWAGEDRDLWHFCDEHDPRNVDQEPAEESES